MSNAILEGAGPYYYEGNDIGVIIIHGGGGGTCADLKPLAEDLHKEKGYTIVLPLLPGFGTRPENMEKATIAEWKQALEKEIEELQPKVKKLFLGGHSMGGVLSLILASKFNFDGIFTISAPIGIKRFVVKLAPFFNLFIKYYPTEWEKFEKETNGKWVGYKKIPLNIAKKINRLLKELKAALPKVRTPALIMQGRHDSEIKPNSMNYIYQNINSEVKKKVWLENNDHPILLCPDHEYMVIQIAEFIESLTKK
ncbi:MAG: alpha/beta fold hydrolase [Promethearchaeota archaeon]|nr:MAG: alpha/beta fold hydrolase [Candidatus Lokiarchaeota archaeon]